MYQPIDRQLSSLAFLWPALAAASASDVAALMASQFASLAVGAGDAAVREPEWATPHTIALELETVRLRDFCSAADGVPALLCAPLALHGAVIADLTPGHSLVGAMRQAGLGRLFVAEWRSATPQMRFLAIDDYLADLNLLVDELGGIVDLVGLCQGGWMALVYAARFPGKVRKLVLAGAPIDVTAAPSALSELAAATPSGVFRELVRLGDGLLPGHKVAKFWGVESVTQDDVRQALQAQAPLGSADFAALEAVFREWHAWTIDLSGRFFLEIVDRLYKRNELAAGSFVALGKRINLATVSVPIFMLAARHDELVAPEQLFAAERLVGTATPDIRKAMVPCCHVALFMGKTTLEHTWPAIVRWIAKPMPAAAAA
jgi:poly(3-hydroxybutyrate) depolymerase